MLCGSKLSSLVEEKVVRSGVDFFNSYIGIYRLPTTLGRYLFT